MIDIGLIRSEPDAVRAALARRGDDPPIDRILELDERRRALQTQADEGRGRQKKESARVRDLKGDEKQKLLDVMKALSDEIKTLASEEETVATAVRVSARAGVRARACARAFRRRSSRRARFHAGHPSGARAARGDGGHGVPPDRRTADLPPRRRRAVSGRDERSV